MREGPMRSTMPVRTSGMQHRISCMHWNPGGLSQSSFLEIRHWLQQHPQDIVTLVETKWSFNSCWHDDHWNYIHSATSEHKSGGILIMISTRLIHHDHIGFHPVIDGRLLHVRLHFAQRAMDLITVYQFVDTRTTLAHRNRRMLWNQLTEYIGDLPSRNQLLCTGDFNCSLHQNPPWSGTQDFYWQGTRLSGTQHRDMDVFMQCLKQHSLVALNTWQLRSGPTYFHGSHASRIDYMLCRLVNCDGLSKRVTYLPTAEFLPMNSTHHIPMVCTLMKRHVAYHRMQNPQVCTYQQRADCRQAAQQDSENWQRLQQITQQTLLQANLHDTYPSKIVETIHDDVSNSFSHIFPKRRQMDKRQDNTEVHGTITSKWYHLQQVRHVVHHHSEQHKRKLFQVWYHWSRFRCLEKRQRTEARLARVQKFHDLCTEVQTAAHQQDAHRMFSIINRYTPKRAHARIRLRTESGHIADQYTAHDILVKYVHDTWQGPELHPHTSDSAPGVPFGADQLQQALSTVHMNKSVASPLLPAVIWAGTPEPLMATPPYGFSALWLLRLMAALSVPLGNTSVPTYNPPRFAALTPTTLWV